MNDTWTFDALPYERPDLEAYGATLRALTEQARNAATFEELLAVMAEAERATSAIETLRTMVSIRHTIDTADEFLEAENLFFDKGIPTVTADRLAFYDALAESPFRPQLEQTYGKQLFTAVDLQKRAFTEANIPLMQREAELCDEYQKIIASCAIEFDGQTLNLFGIQKYFENPDRDLRAAAFEAYANFYESHEQRFEEIWGELIELRNQMGVNLGFENFIPLGYLRQGRSDYGVPEVECFRQQVVDVLVPLCSDLYEAQARRLGIDHVMAYDEKRVFPDGNARVAGDDDFMIAQATAMYHDMSPETAAFIDFMNEHHLLDLKNAPHKASTAYMTYLPDYQAPFVFACLNHTIADMQVLSHEMGHAFAGFEAMRHQPIQDFWSESTDIAEIHSMAMEQFAYPYAQNFFGDDADKYRFQHLQEALTFVPFGTAVDEFQHICYANPQFTPRERTYEWHKLEQKYMPWRRYGHNEFLERGGYWYHKIHIFLYPMYYINYCLTTVGAMEFRLKAAQDREAAWADYLRLCQVGGSKSYLETLAYANLSVPFEPGTVERACGFAREELLGAEA